MKAVMIMFNQANGEKVEFIFDRLDIRGYTWWNEVQGRGSETGEPRKGTHTWPELNSAAMTIVPDEMVDPLLDAIQKLDEVNKEVGIRAFVLNVEKQY
ncbi:MAG: PG0541 family transporter-associated protein [Bacteroides sp.]|jgi:nitrogen regulatory protein PII|nr:PG0541 family transporter-associated protein [Bacteroides sp.]